MAVSSIGVVAVTPTTAVAKPALEPLPERAAAVSQASQSGERNGAPAQSAPAPTGQTPEPDPAAVALIRGTGLLVDKSA